MHIYPNNTTTNFTTYLPQQMNLQEKWCVALTEIQIPLKFLHLSDSDGLLSFHYSLGKDRDASYMYKEMNVKTGVYQSTESLLAEINSQAEMQDHLKFEISRGGFVSVNRVCDNQVCEDKYHGFTLSEKMRKILGFKEVYYSVRYNRPVTATSIANLSNAMPSLAMIYCDVIESVITGHVHTKLLKNVALDFSNYVFGSIRVKSFSPPVYIPILLNSFRTIEISIKDEFGDPLAFVEGTLTITLHFNRLE